MKNALRKELAFLLTVVAVLAVVLGFANPAFAETSEDSATCAPTCWPYPPCPEPEPEPEPDPEPDIYTVTFLDEDGNVITSEQYPDGTAGSEIVVPEDPTKDPDDDYTYVFVGWTSDGGETVYTADELPDVTGDVEYCPWFDPIAKTKWERLWGEDRYGTMAAIAEEGYESSDYAVLCTGKNFPDALVATSVAGMLECPVLLTDPNGLSPEAAEQLTRLGVKTVYVMGGPAAVSDNVLADLDAMGIAYERVAGENRQSTSVAALQMLVDNGEFDGTIVIATGKKVKDAKGNERYFADALSIGPWSYASTTPILLTNNKGTLNDDEVAALKDLEVTKVIIVGGTDVVSDEVIDQLGVSSDIVVRLGGADRYETSQIIAEWELEQGMTMENVAIATGTKFPDALAGAALCGSNNSVLILAKDENSAGLDMIDSDAGVQVGYVLGGNKVVSDELFDHLKELTD